MSRLQSIDGFSPRPVAEADRIDILAQRYLRSLQARNRAANTLNAYRRDLEQLAGFLAGRGITAAGNMTARLLEDFARALRDGQGNRPRTVARKMETVKGFVRFAVRHGVIPPQADPLIGAELDIAWHAEPPRPPETGSLMAMIRAIPSDTPQGKRDRALFRLMFDSALRLSAVIGLDVYDPMDPPRACVWPNGVIHYTAKGGAVKTAWCDDRTLAALDAWLAVRHAFERRETGPALFLSNRGRRMTRQTVHALIKKYGAAAGMPDVHCHLLRHRRIRDVLDATDDLKLAQDLGGHASISTTAGIYGTRSETATRQRLAGVPLEPEEGAA